MVSIKRDDNSHVALFGVSSVDGVTPTPWKVNPATGAALIDSASLYAGLDTRYLQLTGGTLTGALTLTPTADNSALFKVTNSANTNTYENIDTATVDATSLITNSSFETNATGWSNKGTGTIVRDNALFYYGGWAGKVATTAVNDGTTYALTLTDNTRYILTFYVRASGTAITTLVVGYSADGVDEATTVSSAISTSATTWKKVTFQFITPASHSGTPYIFFKNTAATARTFYIDGVKLVANQGGTTFPLVDPYYEGKLTLGGPGLITSPLIFQPAVDSTEAYAFYTGGHRRLLVLDTVNGFIGLNLPAGIDPAVPLDIAGNIRIMPNTNGITGKSQLFFFSYSNVDYTRTQVAVLQAFVNSSGTGQPEFNFTNSSTTGYITFTTSGTGAKSIGIDNVGHLTVGDKTTFPARLAIVGTSDELQFKVSANATQTSNLADFVGTGGTTSIAGNGLDFILDATTGTKLGTATTQKLGLWNTAPIVQPTTAIAASTFVANTSAIANDTATWDGYTIGQVVKALRNIGLLA